MLAYMCKYAPIEIIEAFGTPVMMMEPHAAVFTRAESGMHPNMCSYVKGVFEEFEDNDFDGMLFTTCCDSSRRLYDALSEAHPDKFFFCIDLPRKVNDYTESIYAEQIRKLISEYEKYSGKQFSEEKLLQWCEAEIEMQKRHSDTPMQGDVNVCLTGARPGTGIKKLIESLGCNISLDLSCTGIKRIYELDKNDVIKSYAHALLSQIPCMRMADPHQRAQLIEEQGGAIDGIICHTIKFCDIYGYEYAAIRHDSKLPVLKIETESSASSEGQILTRLEAFLESLRAKKAGVTEDKSPETSAAAGLTGNAATAAEGEEGCEVCRACLDGSETERISEEEVRKEQTKTVSKERNKAMYVIGIDSGSTSTNAVIMNEKKEIVAFEVVRTGAKSADSAQKILEGVISKAGLKREDIDMIVSTGYGRVSIPFADKNVTEISCHGRGAHYLNPEVRTILDIGGQDSKAIKLDEHGNVGDFVMNDKCAAGTGRFLEMMARTLEIGIDELGPVSLEYTEKIKISSTCSVFAESEVISLIAQNKEKADIARGVIEAIAQKAVSLLNRVRGQGKYMMTGGVAKNPGVVAVLEELLGEKLYIYEEPEIVGALGAALYALGELEKA